MQIRLRKTGEREPSSIIEGVTFVEIFPDHIEYQADAPGTSGDIEINTGRFYANNDKYDFCTIQPNFEFILRGNDSKISLTLKGFIWLSIFTDRIEYQTAGDAMNVNTLAIDDGHFNFGKKKYDSITMS